MTKPMKIVRPDWTRVKDELVAVDLYIGRWRGMQKARFEEFGLSQSDFEAYTSGRRSLLPKEIQKELDALEHLARDLLHSRSYKTGATRMFGAYLMPKDTYLQFVTDLTEKTAGDIKTERQGGTVKYLEWDTMSIKDRWYALAQQIADNRDQWEQDIRAVYVASTTARWKVENGIPQDTQIEIDAEWMAGALDALCAGIPTSDYIRSSFTFQIDVGRVVAFEEAETSLTLQEIKTKEAQIAARLQQIEDVELQAELEKLQRERQITEAIVETETRKRAEYINGTLSALSEQLRATLYSSVVSAVESMQNGDKPLHPKTAGALRRVIDDVKTLNVFDDDGALEDITTRMNDILANAPVQVSGDPSELTRSIATRLNSVARDLDTQLSLVRRDVRDVTTAELPQTDVGSGQRTVQRDPNTAGDVPVTAIRTVTRKDKPDDSTTTT